MTFFCLGIESPDSATHLMEDQLGKNSLQLFSFSTQFAGSYSAVAIHQKLLHCDSEAFHIYEPKKEGANNVWNRLDGSWFQSKAEGQIL